jgi:hypothetical protein
MSGCYETYLYAVDLHSDETCGHRHPTLVEAWGCARWFDASWPFDVVWIDDRGFIGFVCRREDEDELGGDAA